MKKTKCREGIKLMIRAPGKKGKVEYRWFPTLDDVQRFLAANSDRMDNVSSAEKIGRKMQEARDAD